MMIKDSRIVVETILSVLKLNQKLPTAAVPSAFKWKSFRSFNAGNKSIIYVSAYCNIYFFISLEQKEIYYP